MINSIYSSGQRVFERHSGKLFFGILLLVYLFLNFQEFIFLHPVGPHFIRQTDSLSFVDYYQNNGYDFFETGGWYLGDSNGKAACEFPILYYITAYLSSWFGHKEIIFRLISLGISSLGFYHLFRIVQMILKKNSLAFGFSFLLMSSTILLYYSLNFLPDGATFGLTLSGWFFGLRYQKERKTKFLWYSVLFFLFAAWLKITYLIHPTALVGALFFFDLSKSKSIVKALKKNALPFLGLILIFALVFWWYYLAKVYNQIHGSTYFLTEIAPYWELNSAQIARTWISVYHDSFSSYYYQTAFHVMFGIIIIGLASIRKLNVDFYVWILFILGIGISIYGILFFRQFKDHDYYMMNFAPFLFFLVLLTFRNLLSRFPIIFKHFIFSLGVVILAFLSLNYAKNKLDERFHLVSPLFEKNVAKLKGIDTYLTERGIPSQVKVIVYPEPTRNGAFYWIKRSGWNIIELDEYGKSELKKHLPKADYLILTEGEPTKEMGDLNEIGEFKGAKLYRLGPYN